MAAMIENQRVERVLTDRLMTGNFTLRILALSLWAVFAIIYWGVAPWWMIAVPWVEFSSRVRRPISPRAGIENLACE